MISDFIITKLVRLTKRSLLNSYKVVPLVDMVGLGKVAYGGRTLSEDPYLKYISVVRLKNFIKDSMMTEANWVRGQSNDSLLWSELTSRLTDFLTFDLEFSVF